MCVRIWLQGVGHIYRGVPKSSSVMSAPPPPTRLRSKTPDPGIRSTKSPPSARRLNKAQDALKKGRTPTPVRALTFNESPQVVSIQAENPSPSDRRARAVQPAMSVEEADTVLAECVSRLKGVQIACDA